MVDVNLTGQIAANLIQNPINTMSAGAIGGLVTGLITLYAVKMTNKKAEERERQNRLEERRKRLKEKQWEVFSRLKGIQSALAQDYMDTYQSGVFAVNHEVAARLHTEVNNQNLHIAEAGMMFTRSHENRRLFAKDRRELYEIIGSILLLFPNKPELHEKINPIYFQLGVFEPNFSIEVLREELNILIPGVYEDLKKWWERFDNSKVDENFKKLQFWEKEKIEKIGNLATTIVCQQLADLLHYLQAEISSTED